MLLKIPFVVFLYQMQITSTKASGESNLNYLRKRRNEVKVENSNAFNSSYSGEDRDLQSVLPSSVPESILITNPKKNLIKDDNQLNNDLNLAENASPSNASVLDTDFKLKKYLKSENSKKWDLKKDPNDLETTSTKNSREMNWGKKYREMVNDILLPNLNYQTSKTKVNVELDKKSKNPYHKDQKPLQDREIRRAQNLQNMNETKSKFHENKPKPIDVTTQIGRSGNNAALKSKQVKLTTKQGLIMNQVLATYALDDLEPGVCRSHIEEFKTSLRAFEPWALKILVFDSSSKLPAGILLGNMVDFGSFEQCLEISQVTNSGTITGKHCSLMVVPSEDLIKKVLSFRNISEKRYSRVKLITGKAVFIWSVCVPQSCSHRDVFRHFNRNIIEITLGLDLRVDLDQEHCITSDDTPRFGLEEYLVISIAVAFLLIQIVASVIDYKCSNQSRVIKALSTYSNYQKLISSTRRPNEITCLQGLKAISIIYVVLGHRYIFALFFPLTNFLKTLDWILNYTSTPILGGTVTVDVFFLVSATVVAVGFLDHLEHHGRINLFLFYLHRHLRVAPALAMTILCIITLIPHFGSGPMWRDTVRSIQLPCRYYWWSALLHIQSFVNPHAVCIIQTWFSTCEMSFYYFSPVILYPLWKWPLLGRLNLILWYVTSVGLSFYLAWINEYDGAMPATNQLFELKYFQEHYIQPYARASPYIIGLALGYAIFKTKHKIISINPIWRLLAWILAFATMLFVILKNHDFQTENYVYNRLESSLYLSCSRSAYVSSVAWIIWACVHGYGGLINYVLSCYPLRILGKITNSIFLFHIGFQVLKEGSVKTIKYFSNFEMIYQFFADATIMLIFGFLFTLFYEIPLVQLLNLLISFRIKKASVQPKP